MKPIPYGYHWLDKSDIRSVTDVLKSGLLTQGPVIEQFETKLASYCGAKYAVCVSSGTAALHAACLAAGIKKGDEVITSAISFAASANCVLYCGGRPVFADIQEDTVNIDPVEVRKKITKNTKAVIPVHFAGHPCDLAEIKSLSRRNDLIIIEDAAHALGATYRGSRIGSCKYSDMTIFSFHPVKAITTGEGGAVLTNRKDLYEKLLLFRNHGIIKESARFTIPRAHAAGSWYYEMRELGYNFRLTDIQCALGMSQLKKLQSFIKKRNYIANRYNVAFRNLHGVALPKVRSYVRSAWHLFVIKLTSDLLIFKKQSVVDELRSKGIMTNVHYIPIYSHPYYRHAQKHKPGICPKAEQYYRQALTLPLFPGMKEREIACVIRAVKTVIGKMER